MKYLYGFLIFYLYFSNTCGFLYIKHSSKSYTHSGDRGNPLILTPYIRNGKIAEARDAAKVKFDEFHGVESYSGYFTVDELYDSNLFFWFFPSKTDYKNTPVLLWLQGGPGGSSLYGLFTENGPFIINNTGEISLRKNSWTENHSVIYIDNPVGTGFSFTNGGYAQNETIIGEGLYTALLQFFQLFPELQKNDFFLSGESYAGKYIPAVAHTIHINNPSAAQKINLQGLAIGNGWTDPEHQLNYADFLYQIGLIDFNAQAKMHRMESEVKRYIHNGEWLAGNFLYIEMINMFQRESGFDNMYNFLIPQDTFPEEQKLLGGYLNRRDVKIALHAENVSYELLNLVVHKYLSEDWMQSVAPWVSKLLSHYRVMFYNGQLDICVAYPLTINYIENLDFSAAEEYKTARRHKWYVNSEIAGYIKQAGNLTEVLVRKAGHMVPLDQPEWALDLITKFTRNKLLH